MVKLNLVGQKYNRLFVLEEASAINKRTAWKCRCDCGNIKIIKTEELRSGGTKSCGCLNNEKRSARAKNMYSKIIKYTPIEASARTVHRKTYKEMPFDDFYTISQFDCYYCGEPPSNGQNAAAGVNSSQYLIDNGHFVYNGLDRIDNNLPHTKENCVPCCKYCNYAKRERSFQDFKKWAIRLVKRLRNLENE